MLFFDFYDWTNRIIQRLSCGILHNIWLTYPSKKNLKKLTQTLLNVFWTITVN